MLSRAIRITTRSGPVWCLQLASIERTGAAVIFIGRTVREAVARYQAHSRAMRGLT